MTENQSVNLILAGYASFYLKEATSLILASSNGITNGLITCLKVLEE